MHSPEPWSVVENFIASQDELPVVWIHPDERLGEEQDEANAERIIACVNAMQGIEDPEAFMRQYEYAALWLKKRHWKTRGREFGE
jgi:hypothetical protein